MLAAARKMSSDTFFFSERKQILSETLKALARRKTVHGLASIYHGLEADVYKLVYSGRKTAVKITTYTHRDGNALWPGLKHKNVLRMLETFSLTVLDIPVTVYVMPYKERCLAGVIEAKSFGLRHGDYPRIKKWLRNVLSGLKYLHWKGLCHLNVAVDNVVLTSKSRAQLCDFDSLCKVEDLIDRGAVGLPWWFQPPEAKISGCETDLWSYGILVIDCITKLSMANGEPTPERSWELDVLPRMRRTLQAQEFSRLVRRSHPATDIPDEDLLQALDFINGFLQTDPKNRTPAARAKGHPFVGGGTIYPFVRGGTKRNKGNLVVVPDTVWIEEGSDDVPGDILQSQSSLGTTEEEANVSGGDGVTEDDVGSAQTGAFSLEEFSDGLDAPIEQGDSFGVEITDKIEILSMNAIPDELYEPVEQVSHTDSFIYGADITKDNVEYQQTGTPKLHVVSDGLDEPIKQVPHVDSSVSCVKLTEDNDKTRSHSPKVTPDGLNEPIKQVPRADFSINGAEVTEDDVGCERTGTPISEVVLDEAIEQVPDSFIPEAVISEGKDSTEPTIEMFSAEEAPAEPPMEQVSGQKHFSDHQAMVQFLSRIIAQATEETNHLKPGESAEPFEVLPCNSRDSIAEDKDTSPPEPASEPEPDDEGVAEAANPERDDIQESAEGKDENSYFNQRSLSLDSRINSSVGNQGRTRLQDLRSTFSRVAGYIRLKKKSSKQRLLSENSKRSNL